MIDIHAEQLISIGEACRILAVDGQRLAPSTLWRWATQGRRGVKLELIRLGGRTVTSHEALLRFAGALNPELPSTTPPRTPSQQQRDAAAAGRRLEALGV